jgi:hypothetical protein
MELLNETGDFKMPSKLEREVRYLKIYAVLSSLVFAVLFLSGFAQQAEQKTKFGEIDVERMNIVEKDGKLDLVISNSDRMPPPIINGKALGTSGGHRGPGLLFFNGKGDEDGGLAFSSHTLPSGEYSASGQLMFDQYNNDQIVGIQYSDNNGKRTAGLRVWDRSDTPLDQVMDKLKGLEGPARDAAIKKLADANMIGAYRVFVGKLPDKSAQVILSDEKGRPRLTMSVDGTGAAKITFLDENGKPTFSLPPDK